MKVEDAMIAAKAQAEDAKRIAMVKKAADILEDRADIAIMEKELEEMESQEAISFL